jgi:hypothetical protein
MDATKKNLFHFLLQYHYYLENIAFTTKFASLLNLTMPNRDNLGSLLPRTTGDNFPSYYTFI